MFYCSISIEKNLFHDLWPFAWLHVVRAWHQMRNTGHCVNRGTGLDVCSKHQRGLETHADIIAESTLWSLNLWRMSTETIGMNRP